MIRTVASVTITALLFGVLASSSACSSTSTNDDDKGGTGAVIGGSGGSTSGSGGAGTTAGTTTGTAGTDTGLCAGKPRKCVDADTVEYCDSATGNVMTTMCAADYAEDGLVSKGCTADADGIGCTLDGLSDMACQKGAEPFAVCAGLTRDDLLSVYVGCFHDMNGAHTVIPCYSAFVDETDPEMPVVDCEAADAECLPDTGAGGAGPDPDPAMGGAGAEGGVGGAP
jgi:hypothetical protein